MIIIFAVPHEKVPHSMRRMVKTLVRMCIRAVWSESSKVWTDNRRFLGLYEHAWADLRIHSPYMLHGPFSCTASSSFIFIFNWSVWNISDAPSNTLPRSENCVANVAFKICSNNIRDMIYISLIDSWVFHRWKHNPICLRNISAWRCRHRSVSLSFLENWNNNKQHLWCPFYVTRRTIA